MPDMYPGYERFGSDFIRLILHKERVFESIDRVLGETFSLGPIGAGPGRKLAKVTAHGTFGKTYGDELPGDQPGYRFVLPVSVVFDLDMQVDHARFLADVQLPLELTMELEEPLTINWVIHPPDEDQVTLTVSADSRRSALLQKVAGIDAELRRFILRFVARELEKPHVRKAMRIDLVALIDNAWPEIAAQFLPNSPEDRAAQHEAETLAIDVPAPGDSAVRDETAPEPGAATLEEALTGDNTDLGPDTQTT